MDYRDFELEITPLNEHSNRVRVLQSAAGEVTADLAWPYLADSLQSRKFALQQTLLQLRSNRADAKTLEKFGSELFEALLGDEVRNRYDVSRQMASQEGKGLRIRLRCLSPILASVPWEFIYDPRNASFIVLDTSLLLVRYPEIAQPIKPLEVTTSLQILGMIGHSAQLDVPKEKQVVEQALQPLIQKGKVKLVWLDSLLGEEGKTWRGLQKALRRDTYHIFHFIGHGNFDDEAQEGVIELVDEQGKPFSLSASQLATLLRNHRQVRLVLLNACLGAASGEYDLFSSTAATLVRQGEIPAVVAMQFETSDQAAKEFARSFYEALADYLSIDKAVAEARVALNLSGSLEWVTPVLYLRAPDGVIFAQTEPVITTTAPIAPAETPSGLEAKLKNNYLKRQELVRLLLNCPSIANRASRDNLVGAVRHGELLPKIPRDGVNNTDIENILNTFLDYPGALEEFISYIAIWDKGSYPLQYLETFIQTLRD
jgi:hypothetical protein